MRDCFFSLLRNALWHCHENLPAVLTESEAAWLLRVAEEQTVLGLLTDALFRNDVRMGQMQLLEAVGLQEQIKALSVALNKELQTFVNMTDKAGLDYVVFKGQSVAALYPEPMLRMPGDIDCLVYDYKESKRLLKSDWGVELPDDFVEKEVVFEHGGAIYELHRKLITFRCKRHQQYWDAVMERPHQAVVAVDGQKVKTLSPQVNAVYLFAHLFFHFIREGIGLRQMCDWAMVLDRYREEIDVKQLEVDLRGLGLQDAYRVFGGVLVDKLGLRWFPFELTEEDRVISEKILDDIMKYGNFGKPSRANHTSKWAFKMETMWRTFRNCWKYWRLAPGEVGMIIPRLVQLNVKHLMKG